MSDDIIYAECYAHELIIHTYEHEYAVKNDFEENLWNK